MSNIPPSLIGKWEDGSVENLKPYLEAIGVAPTVIEAALKSKIVCAEWSVSDGKVTYSFTTDFMGGRTNKLTFVIGETFEETTLGGRTLKTTFTEEAGKLVKKQVGKPFNCTTTIEVQGDNLVETMICESPTPITTVRRMKKM